MNTPHCVVIEWGDGTVQVSGPYVEGGDGTDAIQRATIAAGQIANTIARNQNMELQENVDRSWIIGNDGQDQVDVYVQTLIEPLDV